MKMLLPRCLIVSSMVEVARAMVTRPVGAFLRTDAGVKMANQKEDIDVQMLVIILLVFWVLVCCACCCFCRFGIPMLGDKMAAKFMEAMDKMEVEGMKQMKVKFDTECPEGSEKRAKYESEAFTAEWTALFQEADKNGDKSLSLDEMNECKALENHGSIKSLLLTWDINADQKLNELEFVTMMKFFAWSKDQAREQAVQRMKDSFDQNCGEDPEKRAKYESEAVVSKWRSLFQEADKNDEKVLSLQELQKHHHGTAGAAAFNSSITFTFGGADGGASETMAFGWPASEKVNEDEFITMMQAVTAKEDTEKEEEEKRKQSEKEEEEKRKQSVIEDESKDKQSADKAEATNK